MSEDKFPDWNKPATKGEVMQAIAHFRSASLKLAGALMAAQKSDDVKWRDDLRSFLAEDDELAAFADKLGGNDGG